MRRCGPARAFQSVVDSFQSVLDLLVDKCRSAGFDGLFGVDVASRFFYVELD